MKVLVEIEWGAPGSVPCALDAVRKQNEALRVGVHERYRVISVRAFPEGFSGIAFVRKAQEPPRPMPWWRALLAQIRDFGQ